ncbi:MAG: glycosyltransferase [Candidatus Lindowbacteria bacterium]|nr:glycosyltransferase [Candidatus Lindowbacteria bacterium]
MNYYFVTVPNKQSGEWVALEQLAGVSGAEILSQPPEGDGAIIFHINLNLMLTQKIEKVISDMEVLFSREQPVAFMIGVCRGWEEVESWRGVFEHLKKLTSIFFVHTQDQIKYLAKYGIEATLIPPNEERYNGSVAFTQKTVVYTGFYWGEKNLRMFIETARLLPDWKFTIQVGMDLPIRQDLMTDNVSANCNFMPPEEYMDFLAGFEYIWLPRTESPWIYAGRSGITAVATGRPAILTDVGPNKIIPDAACIKYSEDSSAEKIAELIRSQPSVDSTAVSEFMEYVSPQSVWKTIESRMSA